MIHNAQLIIYDRFFATGSDAVHGGCRSACRITFSSPLAIRGGGLANDCGRLCIYYSQKKMLSREQLFLFTLLHTTPAYAENK